MKTLRYAHSREAIDKAIGYLREKQWVRSDAQFNPEAEGGLRSEIGYRDYDLLLMLGHTPDEVPAIEGALDLLRENGLIGPDAGAYDRDVFLDMRKRIAAFDGAWTSFSDVMERLVYALTAARQPKVLLELGSFWGHTLAYFAGPAIGPSPEYRADRIYGVDVNVEMCEKARANLATLPNTDAVTIITGDGRGVIDQIEGPIDFLYVEAKPDDGSEFLYLELLKRYYDKLAPDAWVIAHDTTARGHLDEMVEYLPWVRDPAHFQASICFDVDRYGLELSIR